MTMSDGTTTFNTAFRVTDTTEGSSTSTGSAVFSGDVGIVGTLRCASLNVTSYSFNDLTVTGTTSLRGAVDLGNQTSDDLSLIHI